MIGRTIQSYRILEKIGHGIRGEVYRAIDTQSNRLVALKLFRPESTIDPEKWESFVAEVRTISNLGHPNFCAIFDVNVAKEFHYVTMELLEGETLAGKVKRGRFPVKEIRQIGKPVAEALLVMHNLGIVHGNLRPANIFLTNDSVKILDIGVIHLPLPPKSQDQPTHGLKHLAPTPTGNLPGPPQYMSPEQLDGMPLNARSDLYSYGSILYEMALGLTTFTAGSLDHVINWVRTSEPARAGDLRELPEALNRILDGCLKINPQDRLGSMREIIALFDNPGFDAQDQAEGSLYKRTSR